MVFNVLVFFEFTKLLAIEQIFFWVYGAICGFGGVERRWVVNVESR